jgi:hypothetical protein
MNSITPLATGRVTLFFLIWQNCIRIVQSGKQFYETHVCKTVKTATNKSTSCVTLKDFGVGVTRCRIEVLTAVIMKNSIFRDVSLCLPLDFRLICYLACSSTVKLGATCSSETSVHFQRLQVVISQKTELLVWHFLAWLILRSWSWTRLVPPKHRFTFNGYRSLYPSR